MSVFEKCGCHGHFVFEGHYLPDGAIGFAGSSYQRIKQLSLLSLVSFSLNLHNFIIQEGKEIYLQTSLTIHKKLFLEDHF